MSAHESAIAVRPGEPDWLSVLRDHCRRATVSAVAEQLGYSRPAISRVLHGSYRGTRPIAIAVVEKLGVRTCPYLGRGITVEECRRHATFSAASPSHVRHWKACQACPQKPEEVTR